MPTEIDNMPPGPQLDGLVAIDFLGWNPEDKVVGKRKVKMWWTGQVHIPIRLFRPSLEISFAWMLMDEITARMLVASVWSNRDDDGRISWECGIGHGVDPYGHDRVGLAKAETPALAISRAVCKMRKVGA